MMETTDALASGARSTDDEAVIMHNGSAGSQWLWHDKNVAERDSPTRSSETRASPGKLDALAGFPAIGAC